MTRSMRAPASRTRRVAIWCAIAAASGIAATMATRIVAGPSCSEHDPPGVVSSCAGLVASLSTRLGVMVAVVALLACALGSGLMRTAEGIRERERIMSRDRA
jgi:hypothetical protein